MHNMCLQRLGVTAVVVAVWWQQACTPYVLPMVSTELHENPSLTSTGLTFLSLVPFPLSLKVMPAFKA